MAQSKSKAIIIISWVPEIVPETHTSVFFYIIVRHRILRYVVWTSGSGIVGIEGGKDIRHCLRL
ncbi:hypothetical protein BDV59DRAFT_181079 [Aspergillus ambiguus]|uniref:uncharacterized protein n=1 Tax=Aspergillus ambiguus TaxID=176160 RepID=UPI003CCCE9E6